MQRFSIRDLLWLTLVVAIAVGAWLDRRHLASDNARLRGELKSNEEFTTMVLNSVRRVNVTLNSPNKLLPTAVIEEAQPVTDMFAALRERNIEWREEGFA